METKGSGREPIFSGSLLSVLCFALCVFLAIPAGEARSAVAHVDPVQGVDEPERGGPDAPLRTVGYALAKLSSEGEERITLLLGAGEYRGGNQQDSPEVFPLEIPVGTRELVIRGPVEKNERALFVSSDSQLVVFEFAPEEIQDLDAARASDVRVELENVHFSSAYAGLSLCGPSARPVTIDVTFSTFDRMDGAGMEIFFGRDSRGELSVSDCNFARSSAGVSVQVLTLSVASIDVQRSTFRDSRPLGLGGLLGGAIEVHSEPGARIDGRYSRNRFQDATGGFIFTSAMSPDVPGAFSATIDNNIFHSTSRPPCGEEGDPEVGCSGMQYGVYLSLWPDSFELDLQLVSNTFWGVRRQVILEDNLDELARAPVSLRAVNNIFRGDEETPMGSFAGDGGRALPGMSYDSNIIPGSWLTAPDAAGNIAADPLLASPRDGSFQLQAGSPAIDSGDDEFNVATYDFSGGCRRTDSEESIEADRDYTIDMGAHEFPGTCFPGLYRAYIRGDCDLSGVVNIVDPIVVFSFLFLTGDRPECEDSCDVNDDGDLNITDGIYTLQFLFLGGSQPAEPFPQRGFDSTPDNFLECIKDSLSG